MVSIINNITSLSRGAGSNQFDNIGFSYDGNQIVGLQDNSDWDNYLGEIPQIKQGDYPDAMSYDANGRITRDTSRGITSVAYNRLGLPSQINLGANDRVTTTYRSDGVKTMESNRHNYLATVIKVTTTGDTIYQQVKRSTITTRSYQGSLVRENGKPDRIYNEAGYIDIHPREDSVSYHYYIRDYLGSVRAVVDANGTIEQAADYHSSGIPSSEYGNFSADNRLHTGKEFNNFAGLAWYDNNARMYDPITTRFTTPDPLAEKYPDQSPYSHCANNPLKYVDPNGMEWMWDPTMGQSERQRIEEMRKDSKMFDYIYNEMEKSKTVYTMKMGQPENTTDPGEFNPNNNTITFNQDRDLDPMVIGEEVYHGYQKETGELKSDNNHEFEAKTAATIMTTERGYPSGNIYQNSFLFNISGYKYSRGNNVINPYCSEFKSDYIEGGRDFSKNNTLKKIGGEQYQRPVKSVPNNLIKILKSIYK